MQNHPSDHYMLTPGTIKQLSIKINGSTIEAYMQAQPQEIRSFILDVSYLSIINTMHPSSGIGSPKRENITVRCNIKKYFIVLT